jgi:hypothetical protein
MDSLNRIFGLINEAKKAKKAKKKKNRYDSGSFGMQAESDHLSQNQKRLASLAGKPNEIDAADLAEVRRRGRKKKVNASTEIANILNLIKEAYQDELISEEAFLAIADPIMRSLMNEVTFPDTYEKEDLDDAEAEGPKKVVKGIKKPKVSGTAEERRKRRHTEASDKRSMNPGK